VRERRLCRLRPGTGRIRHPTNKANLPDHRLRKEELIETGLAGSLGLPLLVALPREDTVLEALEGQQKLTTNQYKIFAAATIGDMLDFFDFFLIGIILAFIVKPWNLTFGESGAILLASGIAAPFGSSFWGWVCDKIGRRKAMILTVLNFSIPTGLMALAPEGHWMFLAVCRLFVGLGVTGLYAVDIIVVQEFVPASKRGWVTGITTSLLPAGLLLGGLVGKYLAHDIGWRGVALVGLIPAALSLLVRAWVPESPHWLIRRGRHEEARKSIAWALMVDPATIQLPATAPEVERTRWRELFKYPRSLVAGCLTGLTQTGGVALALWLVVLLKEVLNISAAEASGLLIWYAIVGILGRFFCSWMSDALGRRTGGIVASVLGAAAMFLAGYLHQYYIGPVSPYTSLFYLLILVQTFFGSGNYSIVGPYMAEIWPANLRASGMGVVYGVGNLGKFIGPLGLALIAGSSNYVKPAATLSAVVPGFAYFSYWYLLGAFAFWLIGAETRGRTIEDINTEMRGLQSRTAQIVTAICGILAGVVSVATAPFMPIAMFVGVGVASMAPSIGGILLLLAAAGSLAVYGITLHGILGLLGLLSVILAIVAGIAALITAFSHPAAEVRPAQAAQ
jgi:MFS transporter, putative metabolite:H+ symporter